MRDDSEDYSLDTFEGVALKKALFVAIYEYILLTEKQFSQLAEQTKLSAGFLNPNQIQNLYFGCYSAFGDHRYT